MFINISVNYNVNWFSVVGLIIDFIGVLYLFKYGLPSKMEDENGPGLAIGATAAEVEQIRRNNKKIKKGATIGLTLIILGFAFQLIGCFFKF